MGQLFDLAVQEDAVDIHAETGRPPILRYKGGRLQNVRYPVLTPEEVLRLAESIAPKDAMTEFRATGYAEFGQTYGEARFRVAIFRREGRPGIVARRIPERASLFKENGRPPIKKR